MNFHLQKHFMGQHQYVKKGYITLMSVLVVGAIGVAVATSLLLLGTSISRTSFAQEQSNNARFLANTCADEALGTIRRNTSFSGYGTITIGTDSCSYNVVNTGGNNRTVTASSTVSTNVRKVKVLVDSVSPVLITSWQEVPDF
jgi:Flp pilus assembly protein TadG